MGSVYEDLDGHEGYALRRLPDGTMTGSWTAETAAFSSYVAACECVLERRGPRSHGGGPRGGDRRVGPSPCPTAGGTGCPAKRAAS